MEDFLVADFETSKEEKGKFYELKNKDGSYTVIAEDKINNYIKVRKLKLKDFNVRESDTTRVWAYNYGLYGGNIDKNFKPQVVQKYKVDDDKFIYGFTVEQLLHDIINALPKVRGTTVYFHNLKFDGPYILNELLNFNNKGNTYIIIEEKDHAELVQTLQKKQEDINKKKRTRIFKLKKEANEAIQNKKLAKAKMKHNEAQALDATIDKTTRKLRNGKIIEHDILPQTLESMGQYLVIRDGETFEKYLLREKKIGNCPDPGVYLFTNINNMGQYFSIKIYILDEDGEYISFTLRDSAKILTASVDSLAKDFLGRTEKDEQKGSIDYDAKREVGVWQPTQNDIDYVYRDVEIVFTCLKFMKDKDKYDIQENTIASAALQQYKYSLLKKDTADKILEDINNGKLATVIKSLQKTHAKLQTNKDIADFLADEEFKDLSRQKRKALADKLYRGFHPVISLSQNAMANQSYKGGMSYTNPRYKNIKLGDGSYRFGCTVDYTSMYPSAMTNPKFVLPLGAPTEYLDEEEIKNIITDEQGNYKEDMAYIIKFTAQFTLKRGHLPTVNIRNKNIAPDSLNYNLAKEGLLKLNTPVLDTTHTVELVMTTVDFHLFLKNYDIIGDLEFFELHNYERHTGKEENPFLAFVNVWKDVKTRATKEKNPMLRALSKLIQNAVFGKLGSSIDNKRQRIVSSDNEEVLRFSQSAIIEMEMEYTPAASFITAYGRKCLSDMVDAMYELAGLLYPDQLEKLKNIMTAEELAEFKNSKWYIEGEQLDPFIYTDTDSVHCLLTLEELIKSPDVVELLDVELDKNGDIVRDEQNKIISSDEYYLWKFENHITEARFIRSKTYLERKDLTKNQKMKETTDETTGKIILEPDNEKNFALACCGLTRTARYKVNFGNFFIGGKIEDGKLGLKQEKGGQYLTKTTFELRG